MIADPWFWVAAIPAVALVGLAKGGFSGLGALSLPMVAMTIDPVRAVAILLPVYMVQDLVGAWAFRRTVDYWVLGWTLPGAAIGTVLGYWFAEAVPPATVLAAVGATSLAFGAYRLWVERHPIQRTRNLTPGWVGSIAGTVSGFTSQIALAGQPPFQLWVLPRGLPRDVLVGTGAVYFMLINWMKVPAYWALGQFTAANLATAALLLPVAIASTYAGVWLVRRIEPARFYTAIYVLMIVAGAKLMWDGLA